MISCIQCSKSCQEGAHILMVCDICLESIRRESYAKGRKSGYDEGHEAGQAKVDYGAHDEDR